jgi:hypothetical protein
MTISSSDHYQTWNTLYVHKAITFDTGGKSFIDVFDPPRRATYFVNFFPKVITNGQIEGSKGLEINLDCPMPSSQKLMNRTYDKLWTRIFMAEANVAYPETLAFGYKIPNQYIESNNAQIKIILKTSCPRRG